ncbi:MAG: PAS domain S-box protein [Coriobacteriia bacterium]|nr:PAS domain S-box protein [Coriobacteriia bacterium]
MTDETARPVQDQLAAEEIAVLERTAGGLREALAARAVYCGTVEDDSSIRFRAVSPVGSALPARIDLAAFPGLRDAVAAGVVARVTDTGLAVSGDEDVLLVPWISRGSTLGLSLVVTGPEDSLPSDQVLALIGVKIGSNLASIRDCERLNRQISLLHDTAVVFDGLLDAVTDAVKVIDLDGRIVRWNPAAERLYGWSQVEVLGERMPHIPEDMRLRAVRDIRSIAAAGRVVDRQVTALHRSGAARPVDVRVIPVNDGDGNPSGVVSVATHAHADESSPASADGVVQAIAGDLRAPLTALVGYAQLLSRPEILDDPSRRSRTVKAIEQHGSTLADLLDEAAVVSRLHNGDLELERERTDMTGLLADVVARFEENHRKQRIVVDFDHKAGMVYLDRRRIEQAIRFMLLATTSADEPSSGVTVSLGRSGGYVTVEVAAEPSKPDTGRTGTSSADSMYPAGMGLHLATLVARAHGGAFDSGTGASHPRWYRLSIPVSGARR